MLTWWAFGNICFFASLIYIFIQYVIPVLWNKFQKKYGFKISLYDFYKYKFEFSADKIKGNNQKFSINNVGAIEKINVTTLRILPKISFSKLNKHWFTIEIQEFCLLIDGRKIKKDNSKKKNKVKKPKVKKSPNRLKKKFNKLIKNIINNILNNGVLHFFLNKIIKHLFVLNIENADIRYITPQNTLINYRQENVYIYSGIEPSSIVTVDTEKFKCQDFFLRMLISPFSINHYRNIKLLSDEKLVYDFEYPLTDSIFESINGTTPILMSEESSDIVLKWTGKVNFRRNIELGIFINGFTIEINEIKNLLKVLKQPIKNNDNILLNDSIEFESAEDIRDVSVIHDSKSTKDNKESKEKSSSKNSSNEDFINYDVIEVILDYLDALNIHLKFNINRLAVIKTNNKLYSLPSILMTLNKLSLETSVVSVPETERQIIHDTTFEIYDFIIDLFNGKMSAIYLENNEMQLFRLPYFSTILNNSSIKDIRKIEDVFNCCNLFQILVDSPEITICETYVSMVLEELFGSKNNHHELKNVKKDLSFSSTTSSIENINEIVKDETKESKKKSQKPMSSSQNKLILTLLEYLTIYASVHIVNPSFKMRLSKNTVRSHLPKFPSHHFLYCATHIDEIYIKGIVHNIVSSEECRSYLEKIKTNKIDKHHNKHHSDTIDSDKSVLYNILQSDLYDPDSNVNFNISFKNFYIDTQLIKQGDIYDLTYSNDKDLHMDNFQINLNISLPKINRFGDIQTKIPIEDDLRTDVMLYFNLNEFNVNMSNSLATTKYYLILATSLMKWKYIATGNKIKSRVSSSSSLHELSRKTTATSIDESSIMKLDSEMVSKQLLAEPEESIKEPVPIKEIPKETRSWKRRWSKNNRKALNVKDIVKVFTGNIVLSTDIFLSKIGFSIFDLYDTSGVNLEILNSFVWLKLQNRKADYLSCISFESSVKEKIEEFKFNTGITVIEGHFSMNQICGYIQDPSKWNEPEKMQHRFLRLTNLEGNMNNKNIIVSDKNKGDAMDEDVGYVKKTDDNETINVGITLKNLEIFYSIEIHYALFSTFVSLTKWSKLIKSKINIPYTKYKRNLSYINNINLTKKRNDSRADHIVELESLTTIHNEYNITQPKKKKMSILFSFDINEFNGELELPNDIRLYLFIQDIKISMDKNKDIGVFIKKVTVLVPPQIDGDRDLLLITEIKVKIYKKEDPGKPKDKLVVDLSGEKISMTVPFDYIVSDIIENGVNMFKATKQIAVRLINTVVNPVTHINPNNIPEVNVCFDILLLIFLDQKFESKLGRNYKESFSEQLGRLARDIAFNRKVEALRSVYKQEQLKKSYDENRNMNKEDSSGNIIIDNYDANEKRFVEKVVSEDQLNTINGQSNETENNSSSNLDLSYQQLEKTIDDKWHQLQEMNSNLWIKRINKLKDVEFKPVALGKFTNVNFKLRPPELLAPTVQETIHIIDNYCLKDADYDLLVPFNIYISVSSLSVNFRDYPLPLVRVPPVPNKPDLPGLTLSGLLIVSEQAALKESVRYVKVPIFPNTDPVHVSRTINPIKMYSRLRMVCSSKDRTFISWGFSTNPALTDMIRVIDGFTKVNVDISENIIWWDKIRLNMHGRFGLDFVQGASLHVRLLGSLSPYFDGKNHSGTDGIEFVFSKGASVTLGDTGIPNTQLYINCGEFKCVVPRAKYESVINPSENLLNKVIDQIDEETVVRFSGDVRLSVGFEFVPICDEYFTKPRKHNEIVLKVPQHATLYPNTKKFDSYAGFRSKEILVSLFIASPPPLFSSLNYPLNSLHLSPFSLNHISSLMPYFSSPIGSLPIRIGKIFNVMLPRKRPPSFKSVSLKAYLLPAILGYVNGMNVNEGGVGLRIRSQNADISIYWKKVDREIVDNDIDAVNDNSNNNTDGEKNDPPQFFTQKWVIQSSKITFTTVEGRTVGLGSWVNEMDKLSEDDEVPNLGVEDYNYDEYDDDENDEREWMTDYDLFCIRNNYPIRMEKFIWSPRVIIIKRKYEQEHNSSTFSDNQLLEKEIKNTQIQLIQNRYLEIKQKLGKLLEIQNNIEMKLKMIREENIPENESNIEELQKQSNEIFNYSNLLLEKRSTLSNYIKCYFNSRNSDESFNVTGNPKLNNRMSFLPSSDHNPSLAEKQSQFNYYYIIHNVKLIYKPSVRNTIFKLIDLRSQESSMNYFTSNALMRRIKQLVVVEDKNKNGSVDSINDENNKLPENDHITTQYYEQKLAQDLLDHLINEQYGNNIVPNELSNSDGLSNKGIHHHKTMINNRNIMSLDSYYPSRDPESPDYVPPNSTFFSSYLVHFLNPQINFELRSKVNPEQYESAVLAAEAAQYKSIRIMDGKVNTLHFTSTLNHRLVKTRNILNVQNSQLFLTQKGEVEEILPPWELNDTNNKVPWPLWCPLECLILEQNSPNSYGYLSRVVEKVSFSWHSASPNSLYINKPMDKGSIHSQSDQIINDDLVSTHHVTFPEFALTANSTQYTIIYSIVMDLIVYSEPAQKQRQEKIQSMLLALGQLEDLSTILDSVQQLQNIIKSLDTMLKYGYWDENTENKQNMTSMTTTDYNSKNNEMYLKTCSQLLEAKEELYIVIEALKIFNTRNRNKYNMKISSRLILSADRIFWTMLAGNNDEICQCDLSTIVFENQSQEDQTNIKKLIINEILLINLMENESSHFRKALSIYNPKMKNYDFNRHQMFREYWREVAPVGGISIVEHFEINMLPLDLRLTYDLGRKLIFYVFPEKDKQSTHIYALNELTERNNHNYEYQNEFTISNSNSHENLNELVDHFSNESLNNDEMSSSNLSIREDENIIQEKDKEKDKDKDKDKDKEKEKEKDKEKDKDNNNNKLENNNRISSSENISSMTNQNKSKGKIGNENSSNQLTQMKKRASKNKTFIYIKVPGVQHCLSYKGAKTKNIVDLYDFTFKLPTMEFRNKTWTWLDLLMNVKKMVISTVLSHTGSLVKTKIIQLRKGVNPYIDANRNELLPVPGVHYDNLKTARSESDLYTLGRRPVRSASKDNYQEYHIEGNNIAFDIGININEINSNQDDIYGDSNTNDLKDGVESAQFLKVDTSRKLERKSSSTSELSINSSASGSTTKQQQQQQKFDSEDFQKRLLLFGKFERERKYNNSNNTNNN